VHLKEQEKYFAFLKHSNLLDFFPIVNFGDVFKAKMLVTATCDSHYCTCLGHLGQRNTDRIISISLIWPRQIRKATLWRFFAGIIVLNSANVNMPLRLVHTMATML
jgi:hypothetical protein